MGKMKINEFYQKVVWPQQDNRRKKRRKKNEDERAQICKL